MQRLCVVAKCKHVDLKRVGKIMNNELRAIQSKMLADRMVIESLIKRLHDANVIDGHLIVQDLKKLMSEPISIGANPVNVANYKHELTDWHDVLLHIL